MFVSASSIFGAARSGGGLPRAGRAGDGVTVTTAPVSGLERAALSRALGLALNGRGRVSPNPLVGAVILRDGEVGGRGLARGARPAPRRGDGPRRGRGRRARVDRGLHARALLAHGRTPPCADALVAAGVARVVIGLLDPLERGRAQGRDVLRAAGIEVVVADGPEADACAEINAPFLTAAVTGRPHVTLKLATSLDGKIATASGESRWISGPASRSLVHRWRADSDAVAVGLGTALADDPRLTARDVGGPVRQPARVVFDSGARLPRDSALVRDASAAPVIVVAAVGADPGRVAALRADGVEVVLVPGDPADRLGRGLEALGERGIQSVFVEGGAELAGALVAAGAVDRIAWFLAPMLIGGRGAPSALGGDGVAALVGAPRLLGVETERVGEDILVTGRLRPLAGTGG